ncbi:VanZ family protein [Streptomyces sp. SS]|uniref:VanZ family protein n=1 Tax=Streptomyces sp. SS TaxID=260742 RepID=UPI0002ECC451|nr:VanZ family protein [Streptomyces sp. SS]
MIDASLGASPFLIPALALIVLATAVTAWLLHRRNGRVPVAPLGAAASGAAVLAATLSPLGTHAPAMRVCSLPPDLAASLFADQGLMNIALFVPSALFLTVATRRPVTVVAALALLSGAVEVVQALTPGMARACDASDFGANLLGALVGCLAGRAWSRRRTDRTTPETTGRTGARDLRLGVIVSVCGGILLSAVALPALAFTASDARADQRPDAAQLAAAADAVRAFFGPEAVPADVRYTPASERRPGRVDVSTGSGNITLAWPSREVTSGQLAAVVPEKASRAKLTEGTARETGDAFAAKHFPWALRGSEARVFAAGGPDQQAKVVQWRSRVDGVLMPMRLDVVIGADRKILSFAARNEHATDLPRATMTREQATAKALAVYPDARVTGSELMARLDNQGRWRVCWMVSLTPPAGMAPPATTTAPGTAPRPSAATGPTMFGLAFDAVTGDPFSGPTTPRA